MPAFKVIVNPVAGKGAGLRQAERIRASLKANGLDFDLVHTQDMVANVPRLLGMFVLRGDATERNNLPHRPVFPEPVWAALFLAGVGVGLARFDDVRHSFVLVWLLAMLSPSLVTTEAPNFVRTLGALPAVMVLLASGADRVWRYVRYRRPARLAALAVVLALVALFNACLTAYDYFLRWPRSPDVSFVWQWDLADVAAWLDGEPEVTDVAIGGLSTASMDAPSLDVMMRRSDVVARWCDFGSPLGAGGGVLVPATGGMLAVPAVVPVSGAVVTYLENEFGALSAAYSRFAVFHAL